jgi:hypothetical protein
VSIKANAISRFISFSVPKAIDVITASGVQQATELDYTLGPIALTGVVIP